MASFDLILSSLKTAWAASAFTGLMPAANIYFDRGQQPAGLAGFPYCLARCRKIAVEVPTNYESGYALVTYLLTLVHYTAQGQTGGTTTGSQVTDVGNLQRAWETVLNFLPPNTAWNNVTGFLHCVPADEGDIAKEAELYEGVDVYDSIQGWEILTTE